MSVKRSLIRVLIPATLVVMSLSGRTQDALTQSSDGPLSSSAVTGWFDPNGKPYRAGNAVEELVDGPDTFSRMVEAIKTTGPHVTTLYSFGATPKDPTTPNGINLVAEGRDGCLYSTTPAGGANNLGTIFKIAPDGSLTLLYHFDGKHGAGPQGGLTRDRDGNFYGTTNGGGKYAAGTIFKITPDGQYTVLFDFHNGRVDPPPVGRPPTEQEQHDADGS